MIDESYARVKEIFFAATELEPGERRAFLARHDQTVATEVESLLRCWREEPEFLDRAPSPEVPRTISPQALQRRLARSPRRGANTVCQRYSLEQCVAAGASSLVYRATDRKSRRPVALKLLSAPGAARAARFRREARLQARVVHPSVLEVYETGSVAGIPFLALKWVDGTSLVTAGASLADKIELVREVALGLHATHEQGIVHRDVKPSNVLVERDEAGRLRPYLADFGIAREAGAGEAAAATLAGTPTYIAPERLLAPRRATDPRSDIYSLGVTCYRWILGRAPYPPSSSTLETLLRIRDGAIALPRDVMPALPAELESILMKCLAAEPCQRYSSARGLAEDLGRLLAGRPIAAPAVGRLARTWRRTRILRNSARTAMFAAATGLLGGQRPRRGVR